MADSCHGSFINFFDGIFVGLVQFLFDKPHCVLFMSKSRSFYVDYSSGITSLLLETESDYEGTE